MKRFGPTLARLGIACLLLGLLQLAHAAWLPAKAALAELLLARSWQQALLSGDAHPPWPGADMAVAARLHLPDRPAPLPVVGPVSGTALAFAPAYLVREGTIIVLGHRDTHFRALEHLMPGMVIEFETPRGRTRHRVVAVHRAHAADAVLRPHPGALILVTCLPGEIGIGAGAEEGPDRVVVVALPERHDHGPQAAGAVQRKPSDSVTM